jgi:hypothetical protein
LKLHEVEAKIVEIQVVSFQMGIRGFKTGLSSIQSHLCPSQNLQFLPSLTSTCPHVIKASFVPGWPGMAQPRAQTGANIRRGQAQHSRKALRWKRVGNSGDDPAVLRTAPWFAHRGQFQYLILT